MKFSFGFRYGMIGYFWDNVRRQLHIFPFPFVSFCMGFAQPPAPATRIVLCACTHLPSDHIAVSRGYKRGDHGELIPEVDWK